MYIYRELAQHMGSDANTLWCGEDPYDALSL